MWHQLEPTDAHIAYALLGSISLLFSLFSLILKEQLFIGEAIVGTIFGVIVGPDVLNWFNPSDWTDDVENLTLELSRIILIIQLFATGAELPPKYMWNHFRSVMIVLFGAMIAGWLVLALCVWGLFNFIGFTFTDSLLVGATFVATDPVLAAAIVGKSKFAQRIRPDIRDLIQSESGANDGLAFPFVTLSINLVLNRPNNTYVVDIVKDWIVIGILYQCVFGVFLGCIIGLVGKQGVLFVRRKKWIDKESFLVFYIALALICTGCGSILGCDDLLVSFAAGCAFNWSDTIEMGLVDASLVKESSSANGTGDFEEEIDQLGKKFEKEEHQEVHVSTIIDLILNTAYFMYFGSLIPWVKFSLYPGRLIALSLCFLILARIPVTLMLKPIVPDLRNWKDALFVGHFGPRGVGSIFCCLLSKSLLTHHSKHGNNDHTILYDNIWNITTFIVVISVIVHGFSITAYTLYNTAKKIPIQRQLTGISRNTVMTQEIEVEMNRLGSLKLPDDNGARTPEDEEYIQPRASHQSDEEEERPKPSRKRIRKFTLEQPLSPDETVDDISVRIPANAYVYKNSVVLVDSSNEVIDEFSIKQEGKVCFVGQDDLIAFIGDGEIVIENGKGDVIKVYKIRELV